MISIGKNIRGYLHLFYNYSYFLEVEVDKYKANSFQRSNSEFFVHISFFVFPLSEVVTPLSEILLYIFYYFI